LLDSILIQVVNTTEEEGLVSFITWMTSVST